VRRLAYRQDGAVVTQAEQYRAMAKECEERAERIRDPFIKQQLIELAQQWRALADYQEKRPRPARAPQSAP